MQPMVVTKKIISVAINHTSSLELLLQTQDYLSLLLGQRLIQKKYIENEKTC